MTRLVCLVNPPGAAVERPSIGLGIIKRILSRAGHHVKVHYENLRYAEFIGLDLYRAILTVDSKLALLDWIFAGSAFPDFGPCPDSYLARIFGSNNTLNKLVTPNELLELRQRSRVYLEGAVRRIVEDGTALVGCSSSFCQHVASLALLQQVRLVAPAVTTMLGGANCEAIMGQATHELFAWVDFVISGDAEELILPLVDRIVSEGRVYMGPRGVQGVFSPADRAEHYADNTSCKKSSRAVVRNMKLVPLPLYDDYFSQLGTVGFRNRVRPGLLLEASRGCWWGQHSHCSFCGLNGGGMSYASKDPIEVLDEMTAVTEEHKLDRVAFVDNIIDHQYLNTLIPSLATRGCPRKIFVEIKANLKREQVRLLSQAGIRWMQPGIESLDSRILRLMRKGSQAWQNILLLKWSRQFGIRLFWNLMFGTPGEQEDWYGEQAKLIPLISHFQPGLPVQLQYCRFSPYCENPAAYGLELIASSAYRSIYPVPDDKLDNLVYFFDPVGDKVDNGDQKQALNLSPELVAFWTAVARWREEWYQDRPATCRRLAVGNVSYVSDTRSCAVEPLTLLDDCATSLLDACEDGPIRLQVLCTMKESRNFGLAETDETLRRLESRGFIISVDGRLISLVHAEAMAPLADENEFPGGYVQE